MLNLGGMLKTTIHNGSKQLGLQEEVTEASCVDTYVVTFLGLTTSDIPCKLHTAFDLHLMFVVVNELIFFCCHCDVLN